ALVHAQSGYVHPRSQRVATDMQQRAEGSGHAIVIGRSAPGSTLRGDRAGRLTCTGDVGCVHGAVGDTGGSLGYGDLLGVVRRTARLGVRQDRLEVVDVLVGDPQRLVARVRLAVPDDDVQRPLALDHAD